MILSKLHQPTKALARLAPPLQGHGLQGLQTRGLQKLQARGASRRLFGFPQEYRQPMAPNFRSLVHVLTHRWELIPLFSVVAICGVIISFATYRSFFHKVDIQLTGHNWNCISRNMDLCNPTVHKWLTFNQQYEPWPELQRVLDMMEEEEARVCPCGLQDCGK